MKKLLKFIIPIILMLPIIFYSSIIIVNNSIANKVEKDLKKHELPKDTVLVEAISAAGKLTGNGNGMQYMGAILITSKLTEEEIKAHYGEAFDYVSVNRQTSKSIEDINSSAIRFYSYDETSDQNYYSVICWGSQNDFANGSFSEILDLDIRGH